MRGGRGAIEEARRTGGSPSEFIARKAAKLTPEEEGAILAVPPAQRAQVIDMIAEKKAREATAFVGPELLAVPRQRPVWTAEI